MKLVGLAAALLMMVFSAACGGGGDAAESADGEAVAGADACAESLTVAYASDLDPNDVADQFGVREFGAEVTALTEDSAVVAGLNSGDFQIGNVDMTAGIKAIQGGVPLKIVYVSQDVPEFVMVSQPDITALDQLEGKTVAYHSPGSLTEILQRELIRQNKPELEEQIDWTVLPESPNRASAMVAGRIDATTLEFLDVATLQEQDDFNVLGTWADLGGDSGNAVATVWVVAEDYLEENRECVQSFLTSVQTGYDRFYEEKDGWLELAAEVIPDADQELLSQAYDYYAEVEMYPKSGQAPLTEERWNSMDGFFRQIGEYEQTAELDIVDLEMAAAVSGS